MNATTLSFASALLLVGVTFAKSPLKELASDPDCQIVFNEKVGEYQLKWKSKTEDGYAVKSYPLKFDPFTGDPLESLRDELFTEPWYSGRRFNELREGLHQWFARRSKYAQILSQLLAEIQATATGGVLHSDCSHCKEGTLSFIQRLVPVLPTHDYG